MIIVENMMSRNARLVSIDEIYKLIVSDRFDNYIRESDMLEDTIQSSIDLSSAINMMYNSSAVSRPVIYPVSLTEYKIDPSDKLYIEFNNRLYNLSDRVYDIKLGRDYTNFNESLVDEYLVPRLSYSASDRVYEIRNAIRDMIDMR